MRLGVLNDIYSTFQKKKYKVFLHDVAKEYISAALPGNTDGPVPGTSTTSSRSDPSERISKDPKKLKLPLVERN
jgi:hypothetical protein